MGARGQALLEVRFPSSSSSSGRSRIFSFLFARPFPSTSFFIKLIASRVITFPKPLSLSSQQVARRPLGQRRRGSRRRPSGRRPPRGQSCRQRRGPRRPRGTPARGRRGCWPSLLFRRRCLLLLRPHRRRRRGPARRRRRRAARPLGRLHRRRLCPRSPPRVGPCRGQRSRRRGWFFRQGGRSRRGLLRRFRSSCWKQRRGRRLRLSLGHQRRRRSGERRARGTRRRPPPPPPREPRPFRVGREGLWRRPGQR